MHLSDDKTILHNGCDSVRGASVRSACFSRQAWWGEALKASLRLAHIMPASPDVASLHNNVIIPAHLLHQSVIVKRKKKKQQKETLN